MSGKPKTKSKVSTKARYFNRELSWLAFNERVLEEAYDQENPLLERVKFIAITSNNLDEFFMVRVGGLTMLRDQGIRKPEISGLTPSQQLDAISERTHRMVKSQYVCYTRELAPALEKAGIRHVKPGALNAEQSAYLKQYFEDEIYPVLTSLAVDNDKDFPRLLSLTTHLLIRLKQPNPDNKDPRVALIQLGENHPRFISLPSSEAYEFMLLEEVVALFVDAFFPGERILESVAFRVTRNADMRADDLSSDLMSEMEEVLDARKDSACVRLELHADATRVTQAYLRKSLAITAREIYLVDGPIDFSGFFALAGLGGFDALKNESWVPQPTPGIDLSKGIFDTLARRDVLLVHPFESFEPVIRLVEEAAEDPDVVAIKQILYRTSKNSPVVNALIRAAENGKHVTAIVELKARFDEQRNIDWARALERAGVQVIYGVKGYKTHAKICIVVRREAQGLRRYMHFGTGNYNEVTAQIYTDVSYMTSDDRFGGDASAFFNTITGYSQPHNLNYLQAAPLTLRDTLLDLIASETAQKKRGRKAFIKAKFNSLVDPKIINALYKASNAGVKIELNIRGICCLRPGVKGFSENITVISIIDRFLEHSRVFYFHHGGDPQVLISSADMMPRNLDKRVELLIPIEDQAAKKKLIEALETNFSDNAKARKLLPDGIYQHQRSGGKGSRVRSQEVLYRRAVKRAKKIAQAKPTVFEPHLPIQGKVEE